MSLNRIEVIQKLIDKVGGKSYLEIGIRRGETIASVEAWRKIGVDPAPQLQNISGSGLSKRFDQITVHAKTSDEYFQRCHEKFDVVFIDGLHVYEQAIKDILNSLNHLRHDGYIVVHDCNPMTENAATREWHAGVWNGDVWKAIYDIKTNYPELNYVVLDEDFGLGIIWKDGENDRIYAPDFKQNIVGLNYSYLENNRLALLNLKDAKYFAEKIAKKSLLTKILRKAPKPTLGCIYLIDEFEWNKFVPWKESLRSALAAVDELIIVRGNRTACGTGDPIDKFISGLGDPKITLLNYNWPDNYSWFDIAHALNYGLLRCTADWCFRLLMDEIVPPDFSKVRPLLAKMPAEKDIVNVGRYYYLNVSQLYKYIQKDLIFRNKSEYCFGRVGLEAESPVLFDNPVRIDDSLSFFALSPDEYKDRYPLYPPKGTRIETAKAFNSNKFIINTDVSFLPEAYVRKQKSASQAGYANLPGEYQSFKKMQSEDELLRKHADKVAQMRQDKGKIITSSIPAELVTFASKFNV